MTLLRKPLLSTKPKPTSLGVGCYHNTALDEDELAEVMEGLTKQFQAVEAIGKLTVTWGYLKER
ncbi:hypothetical protein F4X10_08670 [Candidatus Poribacteria bacterium]|nr:hypothetical protein [Candidatus Poribacteria bacterium]